MGENGQLTPSQTSRILRELNHLPNKKLGQNFLVDSNIVRKSLELANVEEGDLVVEVGPGLGTLTGALLERGAKVFAVEIDPNLYEYLSKEFSENENLNLLNADAVKNPTGNLDVKKFPEFKVVANLPYSISTPWLDAVLSGENIPKSMTLMLQKEAASRFVAKEGSKDYSPISIFLGEAYCERAFHKVSASCFHPRPAVDSVLVSLEKKPNAFAFLPKTKALIRSVFSKRRKQLGSIAKSLPAEREILEEWLGKNPSLSPSARPETVPPDLWRALNSTVERHLQ